MSAQGLTPQGLSGEAAPNRASLRNRVREWLGLERNIVLVSGTILLLGLGENLWKRYVPKYLEALGAPGVAIGAYGSAEDLLDGLYQYPGGWVADRFGRRTALLLFVSLARRPCRSSPPVPSGW